MEIRVSGLRLSERPGTLLASADVEFSFPEGKIWLRGFPIFQSDGQGVWVGSPGRKGERRFFPAVSFSRELKDRVHAAILAEYASRTEDPALKGS